MAVDEIPHFVIDGELGCDRSDKARTSISASAQVARNKFTDDKK